MDAILNQLEAEDRSLRLDALKTTVAENVGGIRDVAPSEEVNNHVHTHYSFSPYAPTTAAYMARKSGLMAVGSVDHDSIGAAEELTEAAAVLGIGSTVGAELRVSFAGTAFGERRLNNPDSVGIAYMVLHGVPRSGLERLREYLEPLQQVRHERNRRQLTGLNTILRDAGIDELDYDSDVLPLSWAHRGGSVTERHLLYALAIRLEEIYGRGSALVSTVERELQVPLNERQKRFLSDRDNPHYLYDLLGVFKGDFLQRFFVQPSEAETRPVHEVTALGQEIGALPAYAYLGDVTDSPTGDKKAQKFEDEFLDELVGALPGLGFQAITYMPPRNTKEQLRRVQRLAEAAGLLEISGVDINSSRQVFTCPEVMMPEFRHLTETTWALIAHEKLSAEDPRYGLFHRENPFHLRPLTERVALYAGIARRSDLHQPASMVEAAPALE
ncbi:MAG: PHP domain-containing protein [Alkalispirochaeta sp.]